MSERGVIAVLDYGIGNLASAQKALVHLGAPARLVDDPADVADACGVVLPGVGNFGRCAQALRETGLGDAALDAIDSGTPFFGVCVGFQLLYERSEESPGALGLGVLTGEVRRIPAGVKCPQMQWNRLERRAGRESRQLAGLDASPWVYCVHSYAPPIGGETVAVCDYGGPIAAAAERAEVWGAQFHPEKSGAVGLAILANFVDRCRLEVAAAGAG